MLKKNRGNVPDPIDGGKRDEQRERRMKIADALVAKGCTKQETTKDADLSRASFYRRHKPIYQGPPRPRRCPVNRLPNLKRQEILDVLHQEEFVDLSPWEVVPRLLDQGRYLGSIRTFYRVLSEHGEVKERRLPLSAYH